MSYVGFTKIFVYESLISVFLYTAPTIFATHSPFQFGN